VKYLTKRQILEMHDDLCRETGGMNGLRDEGMLESALAAPLQSFDGADIFLRSSRKRLGLASA